MFVKALMILTVVMIGVGWMASWAVAPPIATIVQGLVVLGGVTLLAAWMVWFFGWRHQRRPHRLIA